PRQIPAEMKQHRGRRRLWWQVRRRNTHVYGSLRTNGEQTPQTSTPCLEGAIREIVLITNNQGGRCLSWHVDNSASSQNNPLRERCSIPSYCWAVSNPRLFIQLSASARGSQSR